MRFLEVNVYGKADTNDADGVSVVIRWCEQASKKEASPLIVTLNTSKQNDQAVNGVDGVEHSGSKPSQLHPAVTTHANTRLRPTDRLVLNALRARVALGEQVTRPVRLQELMNECVISRRQVQICLRRLTERGLVNRLLNEREIGNQEGYAYKIFQEVL